MTQQLITTDTEPGYIVAYGHQKAPVYASTPLIAKIEAIALFNVPRDKQHLVSVLLAQDANKEDAQFMEYVAHYYETY